MGQGGTERLGWKRRRKSVKGIKMTSRNFNKTRRSRRKSNGEEEAEEQE